MKMIKARKMSRKHRDKDRHTQ
jgi:hypothetical protein